MVNKSLSYGKHTICIQNDSDLIDISYNIHVNITILKINQSAKCQDECISFYIFIGYKMHHNYLSQKYLQDLAYDILIEFNTINY